MSLLPNTGRAQEQNALDELNRDWAGYPEARARNCVAEATTTQPSYVDAVECIRLGMESDGQSLVPRAGGDASPRR